MKLYFSPTVHGKSLYEISSLCKVKQLSEFRPKVVKQNVKYRTMPIDEKWTLGLCKELLEIRDKDDVLLPKFTHEEVDTLL